MAETVGRGGTTTSQMDAYFHDGTGALVDPLTPLVDVIDPSSVVIVDDATPTRIGLGHYHYPYTVPTDAVLGAWRYHWTGTINSVPVSGDDYFTVVVAGSIDQSANTYASTADLRAWGVTLDEIDDDDLTSRILIAQGLVDDYTGTTFGAAPSTLTIYQVRSSVVVLPRPFSDITEVTIDGTVLESGAWKIARWGIELTQCDAWWGDYLTADSSYYGMGSLWWISYGFPSNLNPPGRTVTVTGIFGETSIPPAVNMATVLLAARLVRDRNVLSAGNAGGRVTSESVQAFSRSWGLSRGADVRFQTTGDSTVDDILYVWRAQPQAHIA